MWNYLKNFEFYPFDVKSKGILFLEPYDQFSFFLNGITYPTLLLNSEVAFDDGISEYIYAEEPIETETDYKCADTTDRKVNQTYILVDKQNQKIEQLAEQTSEHEYKLTQHEQDLDSIKQKVSNVVEYKREVEGVTEIHLQDAGELDVLKLEVQGNKTYACNVFPRPNLYPSSNLYSH